METLNGISDFQRMIVMICEYWVDEFLPVQGELCEI